MQPAMLSISIFVRAFPFVTQGSDMEVSHTRPADKDRTTRFEHMGFDDFEGFMEPWQLGCRFLEENMGKLRLL